MRSGAGWAVRPTGTRWLTARECPYAFPNPDTDQYANVADCFWTALNFFNQEPQNRFLDPDYRIGRLKADYEVVVGQPEMGDVLVLTDEAGTAIHACVYIAADVVFTKNGAATFSPWVLMKFADMMLYYTAEQRPKLAFYRVRNRATS